MLSSDELMYAHMLEHLTWHLAFIYEHVCELMSLCVNFDVCELISQLMFDK